MYGCLCVGVFIVCVFVYLAKASAKAFRLSICAIRVCSRLFSSILADIISPIRRLLESFRALLVHRIAADGVPGAQWCPPPTFATWPHSNVHVKP